jgi:dTDP-4-dehydrorhamnose 3,5-epimerase
MKVIDTSLEGVKIIEVDIFKDERGEFSRIFCDEELKILLEDKFITQINRSITFKAGTIRGMHLQNPPFSETKIVRCLRGKVFDVAVDLRKNSSTFLQWVGVELSPMNNKALVIPDGCAHGFQVLEENSELLYFHTASYTPSQELAIRFDEPLVSISWPLTPTEISKRDLSHPYLNRFFEGVSL